MSNVSVAQLAEVLGVEVGKLIAQLNDAGIEAATAEDAVSNDDKKKLLAYLRASHGKVESDATAPKKVTLKRKSVSELRVPGTGPRARATARTVNVEVRKSRTYVKREVVQEQVGAEYSDREEARKILEESRAERAEESQRPIATPADREVEHHVAAVADIGPEEAAATAVGMRAILHQDAGVVAVHDE